MHALTLLAAFVLGVIAVARATRLLVHDAWPPMAWVRDHWFAWTSRTDRRAPWSILLGCPWCASPYVAAVTLAAAIWADVWEPDLTTLRGWWFVSAVWAAGSYLAGMVYARDEPSEDD